jgi:glycosyltransferase involved in cell wall biosynthesis
MLSAVIPVLNEVESLAALHEELAEVAAAEGIAIEIIFIDDGSTDGSWEVIARLAANDARVHGIRFRRNFGKAAALSAGFHAARGERIVTLDADLQDDPHEIPRFLNHMDLGFDVVSGWKQVRHDPWHKVLPSRVFNWMVSAMTGVRLHDHNCGMKSYRREIFDEVRLYGELHRFVPVLAHARGFKVSELVIQHRPRRFGHSKYGVQRIVKGFLDLLTVKFLTGFGQRPQHLLGTLGLVCFLLGGLGLTYLSIYWLRAQLNPDLGLLPLHQRPATLYSLGALLLGGQLMSMGFLAELITAYQGRDTDTYSIAEETPPREQPTGKSLHERSA